MRSVCVALVAAGLFAAAPVSAQKKPALLDAVAAAMGGKDRVLAVRTLIHEGRGDNLNFGQNYTPEAETKFEVTAYRRVMDFANRRWFVEQTREPRFVTAVTAPQVQRLGLDGDVAYNVAPNGTMSRGSAQAASDRAADMLMHPVAFVQAMYAADSTFETGQREHWLHFRSGGSEYRMYVTNNLPTRIERTVDQPMLGDAVSAMYLDDWKSVDGILLPMRFTQKLDRWTLSDIRIATTRVNADANIAATDSVRSLPAPGGTAPQITVTVEELAPGVWWIGGQTHHTIAIEQSNGLVLVEAPQSDARSLAAIAKARELRPGKPIKLVVNTHHHFDHAGGFRAAVSEGLTVLTHQGNKDFYERTVYPGRHTIQPDALSQHPKPLRLIAVGDKHVIRDDMRTVEVYHVPGNPHNGNMLVVYLPAEKILIQADMYNPPAPNAPPPPGFPFAANLLESIQRRGLQVERVVGIHGRPVPLSEVQAAASRAP